MPIFAHPFRPGNLADICGLAGCGRVAGNPIHASGGDQLVGVAEVSNLPVGDRGAVLRQDREELERGSARSGADETASASRPAAEAYLVLDARGILIASGYEISTMRGLAWVGEGVVVALPVVIDYRTPPAPAR